MRGLLRNFWQSRLGAFYANGIPQRVTTSSATVFGSRVRFTCPEGQVFATGVEVIDTTCLPGGEWSQSYIPKCQEV